MTEFKIAGFEVVEKLGEGGMAMVWKARQVSLNRIVAIKILSSRLASDPADIQRFQTEAQAAAKLKHPGIVQVYDAKFEHGVYFFVMEFVAGYTVGDWLIRKGKLSEKDVLLLAECIADALSYAWQKERIIHCDIKPDNIMIDSDGTVKVTDLGLARTISAITSLSRIEEEVLGTPAYMSPEQVTGHSDLDCRADIYSLGAMLYHLTTGKIMFDGVKDQEIMEKQANDKVVHPLDVNPSLSRGFCQMLEVMLAKKRECRQKDWDAVKADVIKVKKGLLPVSRLPENAESSLKKSERVAAHEQERAAMRQEVAESGRKKLPVAPFAIAGVLLMLVAIGVLVRTIFVGKEPDKESAKVQDILIPEEFKGVESKGGSAKSSSEQQKELYNTALKWFESNPGNYIAARRKFEEVVNFNPSSPIANDARTNITRCIELQNNRIAESVMRKLEQQTADLIWKNKFAEAIKCYETYSGEHAQESKQARNNMVVVLRKRQADFEEKQKQAAEEVLAKQFDTVLNKTVKTLLSDGIASAKKIVDEAVSVGNLGEKEKDLIQLQKVLDNAANMDDRILQSFRNDKDKEITVQLTSGCRKLRITEVRSGSVVGSQKLEIGGSEANVVITFGVKDLAIAERLARMGSDDQYEVALVKGLMARNSKSISLAKKCLARTHPLIAERLVASLDTEDALVPEPSKVEGGDLAEELQRVIGVLGVKVGAFNAEEWSNAIKDARPSLDIAAKVIDEARKFKVKNAAAPEYGKVADIVESLLNARGYRDTKAIQPPVILPSHLAKIQGNYDAVLSLFLRNNPDVDEDSIRSQVDANKKVIGFTMEYAAKISDLSALAALTDLRILYLMNRGSEQSALTDLSPLKSLPLEELIIMHTRIRDLTPLRALPLRLLALPRSDVKDVSPLKGMTLDYLDLSESKAFDFSPLSGMMLRTLKLNGTQVKNLNFTRGMPLEELEISNTGMFDFSFLSKSQIKRLHMARTQFKAMDTLKGCPLTDLSLSETPVSDISVLREMKDLKALDLACTSVRDFQPLKDLNKMLRLHLRNTAFEDQTILKNMALQVLDLNSTKVKSLEGLDFSALVTLDIGNTAIHNLKPLAKSPIRTFICRGTDIKSFAPLYDSGIDNLYIDNPENQQALVNRLPKLIYVNGRNIRLKDGG